MNEHGRVDAARGGVLRATLNVGIANHEGMRSSTTRNARR
jgi:hypothetical protein